MPEGSVEEAVTQNCQAIMSGDLMRAMADFTPEALSSLMMVGGGLDVNNLPSLQGYRIDGHAVQDADHTFDIKFATSAGEIGVKAVWREIDGSWKIAAITLDGLPGAQ